VTQASDAPSERRFPVQRNSHSHPPTGVSSIPWSLAERVYEDYAYLYGRAQSLERLAERHGFGWEEMIWIQYEAAERRAKHDRH